MICSSKEVLSAVACCLVETADRMAKRNVILCVNKEIYTNTCNSSKKSIVNKTIKTSIVFQLMMNKTLFFFFF